MQLIPETVMPMKPRLELGALEAHLRRAQLLSPVALQRNSKLIKYLALGQLRRLWRTGMHEQLHGTKQRLIDGCRRCRRGFYSALPQSGRLS